MSDQTRFLRSRVARRVFLQFVVCAMGPVVLLAYFAFAQVTQHLTRQAHDHLDQAAKIASMSLVERLQLLEADLEATATELLLAPEPTPLLLDGALRRRVEARFEALTLYERGVAIANLLGAPGPPPVLSEAESARVAAGEVLLLTDGELDESRLLLLRATDEPVGRLLVARLRADFLWPAAMQAADAGTSVTVRQGTRTLWSWSGDAPAGSAGAEGLNTASSAGQLRWTHGERTFIGNSRTIFLKPQFGVNWTLVYGRAESDVLAPVRDFRTIFALVTFLSFLVVLLLSLAQIRSSLVPIAILREAADRLSRRDLDSRVRIDTDDEFAELGDAFNEMADRVREHTSELERANRAKSQFLAHMSHEVRTPMTTILSVAALSRADDCTDAERQRYIEMIAASGEHLMTVIGDILDVSKIEAGKTYVQRAPCSPIDLLREVRLILEGRAVEKGIELRVDVRAPVPETIETDVLRLRQILINLIGNALKFTDEGHVAVSMFLLPERAGRRLVAFEVRDTGIGIAAEDLAKVFESFAQVDSLMSRRYGGTGLGLSISRALARLLGGDVTCESQLGAGSTFRVTIDPGSLDDVRLVEPDALDTPGTAVRETKAAMPALPCRVLLVEDVRINRRLVGALMKRAGIDVEEAENGRVALEMGLQALEQDRPYDVILMDIQMPEMDGYEATRRLRAGGYTAGIVALTAHAFEGERERCFEAGCDGFLTKPIDKALLFETLASVGRSGEAPEAA